MGIQNNRKIRAVPAYPGRLVPLEIFGLGNSAWDFLGLKFWSRDFFGFRLKRWRFVWLIFAPIDHPCHFDSNPEYPPGLPTTQLTVIRS